MYKFVSICNGTRDSCAYTRWKMDDAPRILFVPPVTIIREWQAERGNPSIRQIDFEASPFPPPRTRPSRCDAEQPPSRRLNSIKRFHLHFAARTVFRKWKQEEDRTTATREKFPSSSCRRRLALLIWLIFVQQRLRCIGHLCCNDLTYFDEISFKV